MCKPRLLVVTGMPGAGKTTFAKALGDEIHMPVISRDHIKEGYVHSLGMKHADLPPEANGIATDIFSDTLKLLVSNRVSVIAEAAFQHKVWSPMLDWFMDKARIYVLILKVDDRVAFDRYIKRGLANPSREYFHGDAGVDMARKGNMASMSPYDEPRIDVPTFYIDTSGEYRPSIKELAKKVFAYGSDEA